MTGSLRSPDAGRGSAGTLGLLKCLHLLGLVLFLGGIFTFVVPSNLTKTSSLESLVFARRLIRGGRDRRKGPSCRS